MAGPQPTSPVTTTCFARLRVIVADRRLAAATALAVAVVLGMITSFISPSGLTTAANALLMMALALVAGLAGGALGRSRWILVPLFIAYAAGVEIARIGVIDASLDIRLDNAFGIIAFVLTRGLHGLLAILPMALGVVLGIRLARRLAWASVEQRRRRPIGTGLLAVAVGGLAVLIAWPASTPPVLGPDGQPVAGSIAELATVRAGDADLAVMIRAADPDKPVLLYLAGGPGQSDLALARVAAAGWTQDFVFVNFDQRGNGKSYAAIDAVGSMTLDRAVADVIDVTEYVRSRFEERKVYLMGESWGTILGVLAVQRRPDLYHAWIGSGQMVDVVETDGRVYDDLVAYAGRVGDTALAAKLGEIGRPPYRDIPWANSNLLAWYEYLYKDYTPSPGYLARGDAAGLDPFGILGSEYSFIEKANVLRGLIDTFAILYPQLYDLDFRESARLLEVPVYILAGKAELAARQDVMLEWFNVLDAPTTELVSYEDAAHAVAFEQADEVQRLMTETIVPATYSTPDLASGQLLANTTAR